MRGRPSRVRSRARWRLDAPRDNALNPMRGMSDARILHLVIRDRTGWIGHQAIGGAIAEADGDASLTTLSMRKGLEPLAAFCVHSPRQAESAKRTLAELGDVDFEESDFAPQWFDALRCLETIDGLLAHRGRGRRSLTEAVRGDLDLLRRALGEAHRRSCTFYLVELEPGETLEFPSIHLID